MPDSPARRVRIVAAVALAIVLAAGPVAAEAFTEAEFDKAVTTLRCDCGCHPQSLKDCACGYAAQKRDEIHERMSRENMNGDALIAAWVEEFGEQILISPTTSGFNLVAWLGPLAGLVVAVAMMVWLLFRWRSRSHYANAPTVADMPATDDPYLERLQKKLQEME